MTADTAPPKPTQQLHPTQPTTAAPAGVLSDADKREIDRWLSDNEPVSAEQIVDKLRALSNPQQQNPIKQQYLVNKALAGSHCSPGNLGGLVRKDSSLRALVAEGLANRAAELAARAVDGDDDNPLGLRSQARIYAFQCLEAMRDDPQGLGLIVSHLLQPVAVQFAQAFGCGNKQYSDALSVTRGQVLIALNSVPHTDATSAIAQTFHAQTSPVDVMRKPQLIRQFAMALAREWHPNDAAKATVQAARLEGLMEHPDRLTGVRIYFGGSFDRKLALLDALRDPFLTTRFFDRETLDYYGGDPARFPVVANAMARALISAADGRPVSVETPAEGNTRERLAGILQTEPGQRLFFSGKAPAAATALARKVIRSHPEITFETFGGMKGKGNPWLIPELARPIAEAYAAGSDVRIPPPLVPGAFGVENFVVGPALRMVPTLPKGEAWRDLLSVFDKMIAGGTVTPKEIREQCKAVMDLSLYDGPDQAIVGKIAKKIRHVASTDPPRVDVEYVTVITECGPIQCPRFRVQNGGSAEWPTYAYVDNTGDDYANLAAWEKKNQLPDGIVYYPKIDEEGTSILASRLTPEADKSTAGKVLDTAALVGCYAAGGAALVVSGGTLAVVVAGVATASGMWMGVRAGVNIYDRYDRGQGVLNRDTLGDLLTVVSALAGAGALAAELKGAASVRALQKAASGVNLAGFGYQAAMLEINSRYMTPEQIKAELWQMIATGGLMIAHGAASRQAAPRALPGQSPLKALDAGPTVTPVAPVPTSQTANASKTATPATPGPTMVTPLPPYMVPWTVSWTPATAPILVPAKLWASPGGGQPSGPGASGHVGLPAQASPPRRAAGRQTVPVDPKTQRMAGAAPPGSSDADAGGAAANPPSGGGAGQPPPNDPHNYSHIEQGNVGQVMDALRAHNAGPRAPAGPELSPAESGALSKFAGHFDLDGMGPSLLADVASLSQPERARFIENADNLSARDRQQISAFASRLPRTYGGKIKARFVEFLVYLSPEPRARAIGLIDRLAEHEYSGRVNAPHNPGVEPLTPQERNRIRQDLTELFQIQISGKVPAPLADFVDVYPRGPAVDLVTTVVKSRGIDAMRAHDGVQLGAQRIARLVKKSARAAAGKDQPAKLRVLIASGYSVTEQHGAPLPETDGPPGAGLLGHDLQQLSNGLAAKGLNVRIEVTYVTDPANAPVQEAVNKKLGLKDAKIHVFDAPHGPEADTAAKKLLDEIKPDVVLFTERPGQTHEGQYRNMRGISVKGINPPLDALLRIADNPARHITTIAVGDGGNEAGMGGVNLYMPPSILDLSNVPAFPTSDIYSINSVGQPVTASVSNWGAQALGGAVLREFGLLDTMHSGGQVRDAITAAGEAGAVDGVTRLKPGEVDAHGQLAGVDGLSTEAHVGQHNLLRAALADPTKVSTQPQLEPIIFVIFDSSHGAMIAAKTIIRIIQEKTGRPVQIVILADHLNAPFGAKSGEQVAAYTQAALQIGERLSEELGGVDEIVMACNTACAEGKTEDGWGTEMEILDLIEVTSRAMIDHGGKTPVIIATEGTIRSRAYPARVAEEGTVNISDDHALAAPEWATIVNHMLHESKDPATKAWVDASIKQIVDTIPLDATSVWLNCTHYPELRLRIWEQLNIRAKELEIRATAMEIGGERPEEANRLFSDAETLRTLRIVDPMAYQADAVIKQRGLTVLPPDQRGKVGRENTPPPVIVTSGDARTVYDSARALMGRTDVRVVNIERFGPETDIDRIPGIVSAPRGVNWREALTAAMRLREAQGRHNDADTRRIYNNILRKAVPPDIVDPSVAPAAP